MTTGRGSIGGRPDLQSGDRSFAPKHSPRTWTRALVLSAPMFMSKPMLRVPPRAPDHHNNDCNQAFRARVNAPCSRDAAGSFEGRRLSPATPSVAALAAPGLHTRGRADAAASGAPCPALLAQTRGGGSSAAAPPRQARGASSGGSAALRPRLASARGTPRGESEARATARGTRARTATLGGAVAVPWAAEVTRDAAAPSAADRAGAAGSPPTDTLLRLHMRPGGRPTDRCYRRPPREMPISSDRPGPCMTGAAAQRNGGDAAAQAAHGIHHATWLAPADRALQIAACLRPPNDGGAGAHCPPATHRPPTFSAALLPFCFRTSLPAYDHGPWFERGHRLEPLGARVGTRKAL